MREMTGLVQEGDFANQVVVVKVDSSPSLVGVAIGDTQEAERLLVRLFVLDVVNLAISLLDAQMLQPKW